MQTRHPFKLILLSLFCCTGKRDNIDVYYINIVSKSFAVLRRQLYLILRCYPIVADDVVVIFCWFLLPRIINCTSATTKYCNCADLIECLVVICFPSAVDCSQPPDVPNAIKSFQATTYSSNVTYTCVDGYFFVRLLYTQTSTCLANRTWSEGVQKTCLRKLG